MEKTKRTLAILFCSNSLWNELYRILRIVDLPLRLKLNEEVDHRESLETVYESLKKQMLDKENELFK